VLSKSLITLQTDTACKKTARSLKGSSDVSRQRYGIDVEGCFLAAAHIRPQ